MKGEWIIGKFDKFENRITKRANACALALFCDKCPQYRALSRIGD